MRLASPAPFEGHASSGSGSAARAGTALALAAVLALGLAADTGAPARAAAAATPSMRGPIATLGNRTVEAIDIQRAAIALRTDPLRERNPTQWRRMLLDRCIDRELLSMEAERLGLQDDPAVKRRYEDREFLRLYREVDERVLLPGIEPTDAQLDSLRKTGLYRSVDLHYIVMLDDERGTQKALAEKILERIRGGASFDSMARIYSVHPSRQQGGHFGPSLVRDLAASSYQDVRAAKPGDVLGLYSGRPGRNTYHQIYKIGGFTELTTDSLKSLVRTERTNSMVQLHQEALLAKYHFAPDPAMEKPVLFTLGSETRDSILASLSPDGTRPQRGVRPALGTLARVDGDSLTFLDFYNRTRLTTGTSGRLQVRDAAHLRELIGHAFYRKLVVRDARDRGFAAEPQIARDLRLARDEEAVRAMVTRARPPEPDSTALRTYFETRASRYQRPAAWIARVGVFAKRDSASAALRDWNGTNAGDSVFFGRGLSEQPRATQYDLLPGRTARLTYFERDGDPMARSVRLLSEGQFTPVVETLEGYAVARVIGREPPRPYAFNEVIDRVRRDWREETENEWVLRQLERMRAKTPVRIVPARLTAVKLGPAVGTGPGAGSAVGGAAR